MPIGRYWYEHPFNILGSAIIDKKKLRNLLSNDFNHFVNMFNAGNNSMTYSIAPSQELINKKEILNSCCWLVTHERKNETWKDLTKNLFCIAPDLSNKFLDLINKNVACGATIYSSWEQNPEYKNQISLSANETDIFGLPQTKIIYRKSKLVRKTARICIEEIGKYLVKNDLGRMFGSSFLFDENEKYMSDAGWHHMGGTVMGSNPNQSVVDKNLKIHGSKNMFILGSSVFPTGGHANPTLSIIQLSLRLSEHIKESFLKFNI